MTICLKVKIYKELSMSVPLILTILAGAATFIG
ncbi:zinc transporter ZupT, partial [Escherichia coli]